MGRNVSDGSESPVRDQWSPPRRRSPDRREKSPARHRSSHSARSSTREKTSSRAKSPRLTRIPVHASSKSLETRSPSPRTGKLRRPQADSDGDKLRERGREKNHVRTRSPISADSKSPETRSPSPRSKRLKRAPADTRSERTSERGRERNNGKDGDRTRRLERDLDRELPKERRERRAGRDAEDNGSSRSRHPQETSSSGHHNSRHRSHSPSSSARGRVHDELHDSRVNDRGHADDDSVAQMKAAEEALETKEKQKPSFELSGKLAAETNRVKGVTLLFTEPPDARKPDIRWRLYVFKGGEVLNEPLYVHRQTCYLFGRERRVADIPTDHPSCSKQHAVLQYRQVEKEQADGTTSKQVRPYIMDLGSTNGTFINDSRIEPQRYYELIEKDTLKFGNSSREYVLLHENSAG